MKILDLAEAGAQAARKFAIDNAPAICTAVGVAGMVSAVVLAADAGSKASRLLDQERSIAFEAMAQKGLPEGDPFTFVEKAKITWKLFIPPAAMGILSAGFTIGSNVISNRRAAAMTALYLIAEESLKEYREQVARQLGEKKEEKIREGVLQTKLDKDPVENHQIVFTGRGETLCYESLSARYFKSSAEELRAIENRLNSKMLSGMFLNINDIYEELGLEPTSLGDTLGWSVDYGLMHFRFSAKIATNGEPCLVLEYQREPKSL